MSLSVLSLALVLGIGRALYRALWAGLSTRSRLIFAGVLILAVFISYMILAKTTHPFTVREVQLWALAGGLALLYPEVGRFFAWIVPRTGAALSRFLARVTVAQWLWIMGLGFMAFAVFQDRETAKLFMVAAFMVFGIYIIITKGFVNPFKPQKKKRK